MRSGSVVEKIMEPGQVMLVNADSVLAVPEHVHYGLQVGPPSREELVLSMHRALFKPSPSQAGSPPKP